MFGSIADTDRTTHDTPSVPAEQLIPLTVLALDLAEPPLEGWAVYLSSRGITVTLDDVGRQCISRDDARRLITERRESEAQARELAKQQERLAVERDQQFRAQLSPGTPWWQVPFGVSPAQMWAQADKDAQPKRRSVLQDSLEGAGTVFHPLPTDPNEDS